MTNVNQLASIINLDIDLDLVSIGNEKFKNCYSCGNGYVICYWYGKNCEKE